MVLGFYGKYEYCAGVTTNALAVASALAEKHCIRSVVLSLQDTVIDNRVDIAATCFDLIERYTNIEIGDSCEEKEVLSLFEELCVSVKWVNCVNLLSLSGIEVMDKKVVCDYLPKLLEMLHLLFDCIILDIPSSFHGYVSRIFPSLDVCILNVPQSLRVWKKTEYEEYQEYCKNIYYLMGNADKQSRLMDKNIVQKEPWLKGILFGNIPYCTEYHDCYETGRLQEFYTMNDFDCMDSKDNCYEFFNASFTISELLYKKCGIRKKTSNQGKVVLNLNH